MDSDAPAHGSNVVTLTSPPRASNRHPGFLWAYIDQQTPDGRACGICIPCNVKLSKGDQIPAENISYNPDLGASFLMAGGHPTLPAESPVPDLPPAGWTSDSHPAAVQPRPGQYGMRGRAYRKQSLADAGTVAASLPDDFVGMLDLATRGYLYIAKRIGSDETPRPDIAKSLAITVLIQYFKKSQASPVFDDEDMELIH